MHLNCSTLLKNCLVRRELIFVGTLLLFVLPLATAQQKEQQEEYSFIDKWDSEGSKNGQLKAPHSIDVDSNNGSVYVADSGNNRVQKFSTAGQFIATWGTEGSENGQLKNLHDVTVDPSGKFIYTLELGNNHRVQKFTADGKFISRWAYEETGGKESYKDPHQLARLFGECIPS
jgi:DNA-binding beta-propeller fold protein YncE